MLEIDIEGAEPSFFRHASAFLEKASPAIMSEVHGPKLQLVSGVTQSDYISQVVAFGYEPYLISHGGRLKRLSQPKDKVVNVLFLKPGQIERFRD